MMKQRHLIARLQEQLAVSGHQTRVKLNARVKTAEAESKKLSEAVALLSDKLNKSVAEGQELRAEITGLKAQISDLTDRMSA